MVTSIATMVHVGTRPNFALTPSSPLCDVDLSLRYQAGWAAARSGLWSVARHHFNYAFTGPCSPNNLQSAALRGIGSTYHQEASALKDKWSSASVQETASRLLSRAGAALRLSAQAFPSYETSMALGKLLQEVREVSGFSAVSLCVLCVNFHRRVPITGGLCTAPCRSCSCVRKRGHLGATSTRRELTDGRS